MLSLPPTIRIWLAAQPADLRKSFDSLAALVRDGLQGDPLSGDIFVLGLPQNSWVVLDVAGNPGGGTSGPRFLPRTPSSFPLPCSAAQTFG